jgi:two-component system, cell cycle response regulator DivK
MSKRVLMIEDHEDNRRILGDLLTSNGYDVIEADNGVDGVNAAENFLPDLILMDIQLPGIDGYEVLRRLRAHPATRHIPVIAISANAMRADIERGRAAGFDDYLTKPIDQPLLLAALRRCLRHD